MRSSLPFVIEIERTKSGWNFTKQFIDAAVPGSTWNPRSPWRFYDHLFFPCLRGAGDYLRSLD